MFETDRERVCERNIERDREGKSDRDCNTRKAIQHCSLFLERLCKTPRCDTTLLRYSSTILLRDISQKIWPWTQLPGTATIAVPICPPYRFPTIPPLPTGLIRILVPSPKTLVRPHPTPLPRAQKNASNLTLSQRKPAESSARFAHSRRSLPLKWRIRLLRSIQVCRQPSADYRMRPVLTW